MEKVRKYKQHMVKLDPQLKKSKVYSNLTRQEKKLAKILLKFVYAVDKAEFTEEFKYFLFAFQNYLYNILTELERNTIDT